jgi:glycosyltransferase involved in cell wall biosynthesis
MEIVRESITIIVPTFNEEKSLRECFDALNELTLEISKIGLADIRILFSDNFSSDGTWQMLRKVCDENETWDAVQLDRNYGIQASLLKAMSISKTDSVLIFQSDLQDPIDTAVGLVRKWRDGADVVVGLTESRSENFLDRFGRSLFYRILTRTSDFGLQPWLHDFYVLDRRVYSRLFRQGFSHQFIRGRLSEEFGIDASISYARLPRSEGVSSFNFARKYSLALDGVLRYGSRIARWMNLFSLLVSTSSILIAMTLLASWLLGYRSSSQGWVSLMTLNLILLAFVGFMMSFIFEFLFRILRTLESNDTPVIFRSTNNDLK